jgi:hypothetical protein
MTRLPRTLKQVARIWFETSPMESAFFQKGIERLEKEWKAIEAAAEEPVAVNFATAKAKEETK